MIGVLSIHRKMRKSLKHKVCLCSCAFSSALSTYIFSLSGDAYNMGSSFSHKVLEQHSNEIQQAIQFDLTQLVDELVVACLVDMDTRNHLFNDPGADAARNARRLLKVVKGRVAQNPADFDKFTEALRESNQIDLAEKLERSARSELILRAENHL